MSEVWKDIPGYEGLYQVSNLGRVKRLCHEIIREKSKYILDEKILKQTKVPGDYKVVRLSKGVQQNYLVHRLVALSFLENTLNYQDIDHIDQNPLNNNLDNLRWASRSLNNKNSMKRQHKKSSKYTGVHFCKRSKKWGAFVFINNKNKNLGLYNTEIEAAKIRDKFCVNNEIDRELNFKGEIN